MDVNDPQDTGEFFQQCLDEMERGQGDQITYKSGARQENGACFYPKKFSKPLMSRRKDDFPSVKMNGKNQKEVRQCQPKASIIEQDIRNQSLDLDTLDKQVLKQMGQYIPNENDIDGGQVNLTDLENQLASQVSPSMLLQMQEN